MSLIETVTGHPRVHNLLMDLAGRRAVLRPIQPWLDQLSGRVVDIGGGTGRIRHHLRPDVQFLCVDLDPRRLRHASRGIRADATALPFADGSLDGAISIGVMHHLHEDVLEAVVANLARILAPSGRAIVVDAVAVASPKMTSRVLWRMDRGHRLHTAAVLATVFRRQLLIEATTSYTVLHHYFALNCVKPAR